MTKPRKNSNGKDHFKYQLSLNDAKIIDVADTEDVKFACEIRPKGCEDKRNAYIIVFPNVEDKYLWVKEIKMLVKEFQKRQYMDAQRLAAEGGIAIQHTDVEDKTEEKKDKNLKESRRGKRPNQAQGEGTSPGPTRANASRNPVSSVIGGSPFSSWRKNSKKEGMERKSSIEKKTPSTERKPSAERKVPKPIKPVSKSQAKLMAAPKPPKAKVTASKKSASKRGESTVKKGTPNPKANPMMNHDFAAQLNATLKARGSQ